MADYTLSAVSARVILQDTTTWEPWLANTRGIADQFNVWELCDPTKEKEPAALLEPQEPDLEEVRERATVLGQDWYKTLKAEQSVWSIADDRYMKKRKGLSIVVTAIRNSIHPSFQAFIISQDSAYKLLRNLRMRFSPDCDPTYLTKLRHQWRNLNRGLDRNTDIDIWLLNWETLQVRCMKAGITEAKDASIQFLDSISVMSPAFHETWTLRLEDRKVEFSELITE